MQYLPPNFTKDHNGIYCTQSKSQVVSYPPDGNEVCYDLEDESFWFKHRNRIIFYYIKKYRTNGFFCDIGGGNGYVAKGLQDLGIKVLLLEPGYQGCLNAKRRGIETVLCGRIEEVGAKDIFDSVGMFDVLEHISDDTNFLIKINKLLIKNGLIFLTVPAGRFLWSKDDQIAGHFRRYTLSSLKSIFKKTGFEIIDYNYFFSFLIVPIFILKTLLGLIKQSNPKKDHMPNKIIDFFSKYEQRIIEKGKKCFFGSSIIIVAKKTI